MNHEIIRRAKTWARIVRSDEKETAVLSAIQPNGSLCDLGWYLAWTPGDERATLDGEFNADELEAIALHMRKNS